MTDNTSELHELRDLNDATQLHEQNARDFALPPADGGKQAWLCLIACFNIEALVWGFPYSFGLFEKYYSEHEPFSKDSSRIAAIGTTCLGIMYFSAPFINALYQRWPNIRRPSCWYGLAIIIISLVAASFSTSYIGLLMTQGILYSIGGGILYYPAIVFVDEWFIRRKGIAMGTMWAGTGISGIVVPFLMQWLLQNYGFRTALRVWAIAMACLTTPTLIFMKPRIPVTAASRARPTDMTFLTSSAFWLLLVGSILQNLGFFMPSIYLPAYANSIGLESFTGTLALSFFNAATVLGAISLGALVDRYHVTTAILVSAIGSGIAVLLFWGLALSQPMLYIFAILYGVFGGGFSSTWSGCAASIRQSMRSSENPNAGLGIENGMVLSFMAAGKGIGAVVSGPLSSLLISNDSWKGHVGFGYGSGYGGVITFTGISACFGCLPWIAKRLGFF